jgi:hypothetical protein
MPGHVANQRHAVLTYQMCDGIEAAPRRSKCNKRVVHLRRMEYHGADQTTFVLSLKSIATLTP